MLAFAPKIGSLSAESSSWFARTWQAIGVGGRISLIALGCVIGLYLGYKLVRALLARNLRSVLIGFTSTCLVLVSGFGFWASRLPKQRGAVFVFWHELVRIGAVVSGMFFVIGFTLLAMPWVLDRVERRSFTSFVAARHVRAHKSGFLTIISILSILGVWISSLALCAVVSIMGGFGADLKRKILGNNAHVRIETKQSGGFQHWHSLLDDMRLVPGVAAATPVVGGEAMASSVSNTAGVMLRGIDSVTVGTVIDILQNIEIGKFQYLDEPKRLLKLPPEEPIGVGPGGELYLKGPDLKPYLNPKLDAEVEDATNPPDVYPGIVIGRELAKSLHVYVGDELTLVSPLGDLGPMGVMPRSRKFRVAAIFFSGMWEYDQTFAYVKLDAGQEFLDLGQNITAVEMRLTNAEQVAEVRPGIENAVKRDDVRVRDWKEMNKNLFSALKLEKIATFVILSLTIMVASFCIICTLLLMVTEKSKEIAILKSLGTSDAGILRIFMTEGIIIGGIGTVLGVSTGLAATLGLLWFGVRLDPEVYYVDHLPINVDPGEYALVALSAMLITTLATVYPALAASRLRPVEGIRYE